MRSQLLLEALICADETTVQVLKEQDRKPQNKFYMWVCRSGEFTENPVVIYDYQPSRAANCASDFLGDYAGYLLSDGYTAYNCLDNVTQTGCMAHARRKFTEAQKSQPTKKVGKAEKALNYIGQPRQAHFKALNLIGWF